jgi:uncharacterized protein (TIGR02453 family)
MRDALRMDDAFGGFEPEAFAWFAGLERDNTKDYFTRTRPFYEQSVRGELEALLDELGQEFGGTARVFRQQRDIRFTPDKSPYKTRTYGVLMGAPSSSYVELSARGLYAGSGYYQLMPDQLERYRAAVAADDSGPGLVDATAAVQDAGLELAGAELKTAPRGYPRDHPRIELLRRKALFAGVRLPPAADGIPRADALEHVAGTWRAVAPLNDWMHAHVGHTTLERERPGRRR